MSLRVPEVSHTSCTLRLLSAIEANERLRAELNRARAWNFWLMVLLVVAVPVIVGLLMR